MRKKIKPKNSMTRWQFEKRLGTGFETWKAYSKEVQERVDCFCKNTNTGQVTSARDWGQLAQRVGLEA